MNRAGGWAAGAPGMTAAGASRGMTAAAAPVAAPRLVFRTVELPGTPDLLELATAARDAGHPAALFERPMPEATSVAGIGAVLDVVSVAGGAAVEDPGGQRLMEVAAPVAASHGTARLLAAATAWRMVAARAVALGAPRQAAAVGAGAGQTAGAGPLAIGGFAFRPDRDPGPPWQGFPAVLLRVPALALIRVRGRTQVTVAALLDDGDDPHGEPVAVRLDAALEMLSLVRPAYAAPRARHLSASPARDPQDWAEAVAETARRLRGGIAEKVVLAREVVARADGVVGAGAVLRALRTSYPSCFTYLVPGSDGTALVGATPELLVRRSGLVASSQPMAGSARRGADEGEDEALAAALLASPKDRHEHAVVVAAMVESLSPLARRVEASDTPEVVRFTNIQHLATTLRAELADPPANALEVCAALQPTPAVGGAPLAPALALIDELEGLERGWYAGAVGWMDAGGDGEFAVALRCGLLWEDGARLYAGVGVMADSDASAELAETELKLRALIGALGG